MDAMEELKENFDRKKVVKVVKKEVNSK